MAGEPRYFIKVRVNGKGVGVGAINGAQYDEIRHYMNCYRKANGEFPAYIEMTKENAEVFLGRELTRL